MNLPIFQIVNYLLILIVFIILIRYTWDMIFDRDYQPSAWQQAKKAGNVSRDLIRLERNYPDKVRFFNWWLQIERLKRNEIRGSFAELGVYKGDSARIIHLMDTERTFHLFDTFHGFTEEELKSEIGTAATYRPSDFADTSLEKVRKKIGKSENLVFHLGIFPATTSGLEKERFALVNIDADLYHPTKNGLEFFYPRLLPGGVILIHDYNEKWDGVVRAVNEFSLTIPEHLIQIPDMEGSIMIIRNK